MKMNDCKTKCEDCPDEPPQRTEQEPPKYSFKAHWEKDGRIGVVAAIVRSDGGVHILEDIIDAPQRKPLTDEDIYMNCPNWLSQEQCKVWIQQIEAKLKEKNT